MPLLRRNVLSPSPRMVRVKGQFFYLFVNGMVRFHSIHEATGHKGHENIDKTETDLKILSLLLVAGIML